MEITKFEQIKNFTFDEMVDFLYDAEETIITPPCDKKYCEAKLDDINCFAHKTHCKKATTNWLNSKVEVPNAPAENAAPVTHAQWKCESTYYSETVYKCSLCGRIKVIDSHKENKMVIEKYPYCNCGAKMDLKGNDTLISNK